MSGTEAPEEEVGPIQADEPFPDEQVFDQEEVWQETGGPC